MQSATNLPRELTNERNPTVSYRPLCPADAGQLQLLHETLFPLSYEEVFFQKAVRGHENIFGWVAQQRGVQEHDARVVGFITARYAPLAEADVLDRKLMDLASPTLDSDYIVYLLTIGVVPHMRNQGIASDLLRLVVRRAREVSARAIYLHVLAVYNVAAIGFYHRHGFWEASLLRDFYRITTGRQPDPDRQTYDALLFVRYVTDPTPPSAVAMVSAAIAQLRSFSACLPWAPRRKNGMFLGNASCCIAVPCRTPRRALHESGMTVPEPGPLWLQRIFRGRP